VGFGQALQSAANYLNNEMGDYLNSWLNMNGLDELLDRKHPYPLTDVCGRIQY